LQLSGWHPRREGLIAYDEPPLRVPFEILDDDRMVRILKVKPIAAS